MSAFRTRVGAALLVLYPEPWRARYGEELGALLEDDPPSSRGLASLLSGAVGAHLRPRSCWHTGVSPTTRMRLSVGALFACWMLISVTGSAFAKETEHFDPIEHEHLLLSAARDMITAGAVIGAIEVALGGLPLVWHALRTAASERDRRLALQIASPALAGGLLIAAGAVLVRIGPSRHGAFPAAFVLETLLPLSVGALACALVGALAPKAVMKRAEPPAALLGIAAWSGQLLTVAILLVTLGLALYVPALWSVGGAGTSASAPFGLSTRAMLCLALAAAVLACGPALLASTRARRAALARA